MCWVQEAFGTISKRVSKSYTDPLPLWSSLSGRESGQPEGYETANIVNYKLCGTLAGDMCKEK